MPQTGFFIRGKGVGVLSRTEEGCLSQASQPQVGTGRYLLEDWPRFRGHLFDVVYRVRIPDRGRLVVLHQDRLALYLPRVPVATGGGLSASTRVFKRLYVK